MQTRECLCDKTKYVYCPNCGKGNPKETWRYLFCSKDCKILFETLEKWVNHKIATDYAYYIITQLKNVNFNHLNEQLKRNLNDLKQAYYSEHYI